MGSHDSFGVIMAERIVFFYIFMFNPESVKSKASGTEKSKKIKLTE